MTNSSMTAHEDLTPASTSEASTAIEFDLTLGIPQVVEDVLSKGTTQQTYSSPGVRERNLEEPAPEYTVSYIGSGSYRHSTAVIVTKGRNYLRDADIMVFGLPIDAMHDRNTKPVFYDPVGGVILRGDAIQDGDSKELIAELDIPDGALGALGRGVGSLSADTIGASTVIFGFGGVERQSREAEFDPRDAPSRGYFSGTGVWDHVAKRMEISLIVEEILRSGSEESFEYGMESELSTALHSVIKHYSNDAIAELDRLLDQKDVKSEVIAETLLQLGSIDHKPTHWSRLSLIAKHLLQSNEIGVRDYAALGLAALDDPQSIPSLQLAIQNEEVDRLRRDFNLVLDQLSATQECRSI